MSVAGVPKFDVVKMISDFPVFDVAEARNELDKRAQKVQGAAPMDEATKSAQISAARVIQNAMIKCGSKNLPEEEIIDILTILGKAPTEGAMKELREGLQTGFARTEKNVNKFLEKSAAEVEKKGEPLDLTKEMKAASLKSWKQNVKHDSTACFNPSCLKTGLVVTKEGSTLKNWGRCHAAKYCSPTCQTTHWPAHKLVCVIKNKG